MRTEVFNRSKYRDGSAPGDDVPLVIPGAVYGVFDGATDPRGTRVDGVAAGRLAALTVASEVAELANDPANRSLPGREIVGRVSAALKTKTAPLSLPIPPSTTMAVAIDCTETWRFLLLGDSGVRINGSEVHRCEKLIDSVSTVARVAVFKELATQCDTPDKAEMAARKCIFLGFENAISSGLLTRAKTDEILSLSIAANDLEISSDTVRRFLMGGIQSQHGFGNTVGDPLCFDTLNGSVPMLGQLTDIVRSKAEVTSIELFTDGYFSMPERPEIQAWEAAFHSVEDMDFHKIGPFSGVKGSTSTEFFDDRTVVIVG